MIQIVNDDLSGSIDFKSDSNDVGISITLELCDGGVNVDINGLSVEFNLSISISSQSINGEGNIDVDFSSGVID